MASDRSFVLISAPAKLLFGTFQMHINHTRNPLNKIYDSFLLYGLSTPYSYRGTTLWKGKRVF